jgi:hypothetical protein
MSALLDQQKKEDQEFHANPFTAEQHTALHQRQQRDVDRPSRTNRSSRTRTST